MATWRSPSRILGGVERALAERVRGNMGNQLPGRWKCLGASLILGEGKGFELGPGLHSLRPVGSWQALRVDEVVHVPWEAI